MGFLSIRKLEVFMISPIGGFSIDLAQSRFPASEAQTNTCLELCLNKAALVLATIKSFPLSQSESRESPKGTATVRN